MIRWFLMTTLILVSDLAYGQVSATMSANVVPAGSSLPNPAIMSAIIDNAGCIPAVLASAPQYNYLVYMNTYSSTGDGQQILDLSTYSGCANSLAADIVTWKASTDAKGQRRHIDIDITDCFQSNFTGHFLTPTNATQAVTSLESIIDTYGFQGIVWDLETSPSGNGTESGSCWNQTTIESINSQLKAHYGNSLTITLSPAPYMMGAGSIMRGWAASTGFDLTVPQYYFTSAAGQWQCTGSGTSSTIYTRELGTDYEGVNQFLGGSDGGPTIPQSKWMFWNDIGTGCTASQYQSAFSLIQGSYPSMRGNASWQLHADFNAGFAFSKAFGSLLGL